MQANYCNENRTMWKITLQDINTTPKKPKTQGHPTRNLWKRPKNNSKAWIKLSETILNILGDCWETFISSAPHSQQDWWNSSQPTRCTYNPQPELLQKFSQQSYVVIGRHRAKFSPSVRGVGGLRSFDLNDTLIQKFPGILPLFPQYLALVKGTFGNL